MDLRNIKISNSNILALPLVPVPDADVILDAANYSSNQIPNTGIVGGTATSYNGTFTSNGPTSYLQYTGFNANSYLNLASFNLATEFTVVMILDADSSQQFWATCWGNENYNTSKGYFAYYSGQSDSTGYMTYGTVNDMNSVPSVFGYATITPFTGLKMYAWTAKTNGSSVDWSMYTGKTSINSFTGAAPTALNNSGTNFMARHNNGGTGYTDCLAGKFYLAEVYSTALTAAQIKTKYIQMKTRFGV